MLYIYALLGGLRLVFVVYNGEGLGDFSLAEIPDIIAGSLLFDTANIAYVFGAFITLSMVPVSVSATEKKWYRYTLFGLFMVGILAVLVFNIGDTMYFQFARKRLSGEEFHFTANNTNNLAILWYSVVQNWYLVLMLVALVMLSIKVYWKIQPKKGNGGVIRAVFYYPIYSILLILGIAYIVIGARGGVGRDVRPITPTNAAGYTQSAIKTAVVLSNPFCVLRTISNKQVPTPKFFDTGIADSIYSPLYTPATKDTLFASQKGKNLVIIVLESFSAEHSKLLYPQIHTPENSPVPYTPFLDSLMKNSYTFVNAQANGYKSIEALPAIFSSIPSLSMQFATHPTALTAETGIGWVLENRGYKTMFFNGSPRGSMGFDASAKLAGIKQTVSMDDYTAHHGRKEYDGLWGIWDEPFLQYFAQEISETQEPFLAALFTISSHHPFKVPQKYQNKLPEGNSEIHKPIAYTDIALRKFFRTAQKQSWYDSTVFVLVADHTSYEVYSGSEYRKRGNANIVYTIHTPDGSMNGMDSTITQQIDILPTLCHLLGVEDTVFGFGRNVFDSSKKTFAINANGGIYQWTISDSTALVYSLEELMAVEGDEARDMKAFLEVYGDRISNQKLGN